MNDKCRTVRHTNADIAAGNIVPEGQECGREAVIRLEHSYRTLAGNGGVTYSCQHHGPTWVKEKHGGWVVVETTKQWQLIEVWTELIRHEA